MSSNLTIDVSGLKGLHIPLSPDIFPLAIGWWICIVLLIFLFFFVYFMIFIWMHSLKRQVSQNISHIKKIKDNQEMLKKINQLAKRLAIARFGREKVASLYEEEWVNFMNKVSKEEIFSKDYVDLLHKSIYAGKESISDLDRQRILKDYEKWFQIILKNKKRRRNNGDK